MGKDKYEDVAVTTPDDLAREATERSGAVQMANPASDTSEQARAVAEIQVAMTVAQARPRNDNAVWQRMRRACQRRTMADKALYAYKRGGQIVDGPTIKLIKELATCFGNMDYGYREIFREGNRSRVEAYAWDLETNVRVKREFWVQHSRDTKQGDAGVTSQRDRYEVVANHAQRRVRACVEQILPADLIVEAQAQVIDTIQKGDGRPLQDRARDMMAEFLEIGVTEAMIEGFLQHPIGAIVPAEFPRLRTIYGSLQAGVSKREEWFDLLAAAPSTNGGDKPGQATQEAAQAAPESKQPTNTPPPEPARQEPPTQPEPPDRPEPPDDDEPPPEALNDPFAGTRDRG